MNTGSNKNSKNTRSQADGGRPTAAEPRMVYANSDQVRTQGLVWLLTIVSSLLAYVVVAYIIHNNYHPNIDAQHEQARELLIQYGGVRPEPVEALLARVGVFVIGLSLMAFYYLLSKMERIRQLAQSQFFNIISFACFAGIVALIYYDFAALNPFGKTTEIQYKITGTTFRKRISTFSLMAFLQVIIYCFTPLFWCR